MVKKEKDKIIENKAPIPPLAPLYSNMVSILGHTDMVLIDFGFVGPGYCEPYNMEDSHISRICLDWDAAEYLTKQLNKSILEHKKKSQLKKKSKK